MRDCYPSYTRGQENLPPVIRSRAILEAVRIFLRQILTASSSILPDSQTAGNSPCCSRPISLNSRKQQNLPGLFLGNGHSRQLSCSVSRSRVYLFELLFSPLSSLCSSPCQSQRTGLSSTVRLTEAVRRSSARKSGLFLEIQSLNDRIPMAMIIAASIPIRTRFRIFSP